MKLTPLTRSQAHNIFCPTGKGGGVDPTCGYHKDFELARQAASEASNKAVQASLRPTTDKSRQSKSAIQRAKRAGVKSDEASSAPAHLAQRLHGEAADLHFGAYAQHNRAAYTEMNKSGTGNENVRLYHFQARNAHRAAAIAHEFVSGRKEEAHRLSDEAARATRRATENHGVFEGEELSRMAREHAAARNHRQAHMAHGHSMIYHLATADAIRDNETGRRARAEEATHRQAAEAHRRAEEAHRLLDHDNLD